jgi:hypothetical protein
MREVINTVTPNKYVFFLINHAEFIPKCNRKLSRHKWFWTALQGSSSSLSAMGSCLDTLTWDSKDPSQNFS